ncbi:alginate lyase (PL7) [Formosa agariphila KMM 3901]|uniref:Alginate lyase (PL7) n=1 Tax=Formosa agariphila (strain DSM 15362 / KCTC 12365 / LMG 23005 / KMM 3901 / M-2Alg 35-1) TaxID=1347342 RepID=T2KJZ2_FORAG|nr:polysaccharide lyase family 7 protein [Formosa agariphila]CDF79085.1 alginate lyase (PL7) [Formosa agariphila KMM 3901]
MITKGIFNSKLLFILSIMLFVACSSDSTDNENTNTDGDEITDADGDGDETEEPDITEENISWKNWYLSVPIDSGNGKATSIQPSDIINDNLSSSQSKYFYKNDDGSYTLWTKFTGITTSGVSTLGDKYCRTELREYWKGNQDTNDNWSMSTGVHILESTINVDYVEGNGRTIVAQIHGKSSEGIPGDPATVKIRWNSGMIQIDHYTKPDNNEAWTSAYDDKIDFGRVDNEIFTFKMKVENGKLYCALVCEAKDLDIEYTEIYDYVGNGYIHENYFKTGNYFGWHDDYEKSAQVVLHKVVTSHE